MAFINADRVKETTIITGTGNIALLGAVSGFRAFHPTLSVGDTFKYFMVSTSGTEWEAGLGTVVSASTLARTTVQSSSNGNAAVNFSAGIKEVGIGPTAGGETPWNPVNNTLNISVNALNDVAITSPTVNQVLKYSGTEWTNQADAVNVGTVTSVAVSGGTTGLTVSGSPITGAGTITVAGILAVANGGTGVTTSTGTTNVVLSNSPTLVTPFSNALSAVPVGSGAGNALTIAAGSGIGTGSGANLILNPGEFATSGTRGTVLIDGLNAGKSKSSGANNTVFGAGALAAITTGYNNDVFGNGALALITTGNQNTAIGVNALGRATLNSYNNVAIGNSALYANARFEYNIAVGLLALSNATGNANIGIGGHAGESGPGSDSVIIGFIAGRHTTGSNNTIVGSQSGFTTTYLTSGTNNTLLGSYIDMGTGNGAATNCIIIGKSAVGKGTNTTVIGTTSTTATWLYGTVTSNALAAQPVTSGAGNALTISAGSGIGTGSGANLILNPGEFATSGTRGTVLIDGLTVGKSKSSGVDNTVVGAGALAAITTGARNVAIGTSAMALATTTAQNAAVGNNALARNTGGGSNVGIGNYACYGSGTFTYNIGIGESSLFHAAGSYNIGIGGHAGENLGSGADSVIIGFVAGRHTTGSNNTIVGNWSGYTTTYLTSGTNNTLLGSFINMGTGNETATNCIIIGKSAVGKGSNTTVIGTTSTTATWLYGTVTSNALAAQPVASGPGNSLTIAAGSGVGTGSGGNLILQAGLQATSGGDGKVIVKQVSGQTGNLQEWQDVNSNVLASVSAAGVLTLNNNVVAGFNFVCQGRQLTIGGQGTLYWSSASSFNGTWTAVAESEFFGAGPRAVGLFKATGGSSTTKVIIARGTASQTANLQEWQDSAGTALASVSAAGNFSAGPIIENKDTVSANKTITSGSNAMSVGPITINTGVSVTVGSNQRWIVL